MCGQCVRAPFHSCSRFRADWLCAGRPGAEYHAGYLQSRTHPARAATGRHTRPHGWSTPAEHQDRRQVSSFSLGTLPGWSGSDEAVSDGGPGCGSHGGPHWATARECRYRPIDSHGNWQNTARRSIPRAARALCRWAQQPRDWRSRHRWRSRCVVRRHGHCCGSERVIGHRLSVRTCRARRTNRCRWWSPRWSWASRSNC